MIALGANIGCDMSEEMRFKLDFPLLYSPTQPYGCVTGYLEFSFRAELGQLIWLTGETEEVGALALKVNAILDAGSELAEILMLDDHLVDGLPEAELLARCLEEKRRFFVDVF
jgi:hypothetical protein